MCAQIFQTNASVSALILRLALGIVFFGHGAQKALGWFGGQGFNATVAGFRENMHIPAALAVLVVLTELLGSIGLIVGFLTRIAAAGIGVIMIVAIFMVHERNGFFMNWTGAQKGEGIEYHILVIGICLVLLIVGGGAMSVDGCLTKLY